MASSSSSSTFMLAKPSPNVTITQDEFSLFHNIDRKLFLSLVVHTGLKPTQAMQFMALFMWFEKTSGDFTLVSELLKWPYTLLSDLTNEAALVLTCIQNEHFPFVITTKNHDLPLTQKITRSGVTLHFFHENRVHINQAVTGLINNVCVRAFGDIMQHLQHKEAAKEQVLLHYNDAMMQQVIGNNEVKEGSSKEIVNNEVLEILRWVELSGDGGVGSSERRVDVPAGDRTIFLTFSKGYPISESEIRDFFSRRYGDIIEAIYIQEVQTVLEQPLYARLVLRCDATSMIEVILDGTLKAKFSINGKHVWARKYVRKSTKSPLIISPPTSLPDSPAAASASASASITFLD